MAAHSFFTTTKIAKDIRAKVMDMIKVISDKYGLRTSTFERSSLTKESLYSMGRQTARIRMPVRQILSIQSHQAITASTGLRSGAMTRSTSDPGADEKKGVRYEEVNLWAVPSTKEKHNDIVVWMTPRTSKNTSVLGASVAMQSNGRLSVSANKLLLVGAALDDAIEGTLAQVLDPAFLGPKASPRLIKIKREK
jgi:hypothetical protein